LLRCGTAGTLPGGGQAVVWGQAAHWPVDSGLGVVGRVVMRYGQLAEATGVEAPVLSLEVRPQQGESSGVRRRASRRRTPGRKRLRQLTAVTSVAGKLA
jgi:hypothetical protein